jgi:hypothetical protein
MTNRAYRVYGHTWTKEELHKIKDMWNDHNAQEIADELGVTVNQLSYIVRNVRLHKPSILPKKSYKANIKAIIADTF